MALRNKRCCCCRFRLSLDPSQRVKDESRKDIALLDFVLFKKNYTTILYLFLSISFNEISIKCATQMWNTESFHAHAVSAFRL